MPKNQSDTDQIHSMRISRRRKRQLAASLKALSLFLAALVLVAPIAAFAFLPSSPRVAATKTHLFSSEPTSTSTSTMVNTLDGVEIRGPLTAVGNAIVVKVRDTLTATGGGILLPDQSQTRPTEGFVVVSGPGRIHPHSGIRIPNPISPGMSVVYGKFDGKPVEYNGDECQIIRDDNVLLAYTGVTVRLDSCQLVRDYVLIAMFDDENESEKDGNTIATSSGVVIAASVLKDDLPCQGRVVKVGPGRIGPDGVTHTPSPVQPGDFVKFKDYAGNELLIEGKPYSVVKMVDILSTYTGE